MIKITPEELVRFLYQETSDKKTAAIRTALETDWNLRETYEKLLSSHKTLHGLSTSPRPEAVNKILEYGVKKQEQVHSH